MVVGGDSKEKAQKGDDAQVGLHLGPKQVTTTSYLLKPIRGYRKSCTSVLL